MLELIIPAIIPAVSDAIKKGVDKVTGFRGTVEDQIKWSEAETKRLQALAGIDSVSNNTSLWVNNIRALMRPVGAILILSVYAGVVIGGADKEMVDSVADFATMATFYMFGDRTYAKFRSK